MENKFGLQKSDLETIIFNLREHVKVESACIFGSRAKGNYKNGSDVDIALKGTDLDYETVRDISYYLNEETWMPYKFDVLDYHTIESSELIAHIDRVGKTFYEKSEHEQLQS